MKLKFLLAATVISLMTATAVHADDITVTVDGEQVIFEGTSPVIEQGRTLVPLRGVFEKLGFSVEWDSETKTATLSRGNTTIKAAVGSLILEEYGSTSVTIEGVQPQIINDYFMVPVRAISEATGSTVDWDAETRTVAVTAEYVAEVNSTVEPKGLITATEDNYIETVYDAINDIREYIKSSDDRILMRFLDLGYTRDNTIVPTVEDYTELKALIEVLYTIDPPADLKETHEYVKEYGSLLNQAINISREGYAGTISQEEVLENIDALKETKDEMAMEFSVVLYEFFNDNSVFFEKAYDEYILDMLK